MMTAERTTGRTICPRCQLPIPTVSGYPDWCERCGWGSAPEESPSPASRGVAKAYRALGARESARLLREAAAQGGRGHRATPSIVVAFVIAAVVHLFTVAPLGLAIFLIVRMWPGAISIFPAAFLVFLTWLLAPELPPKPETILDRAEFPATYALVDAVAAALGTPRVSGIACDMDFNASFGQSGWRWKQFLHLGRAALVDPRSR